MRGCKVSFSVVLFLAIVSPVLVRAQFQQPTNEELKMTADPKFPGAAAVYLDVEEIADDPLHYQSFYARIKVLGADAERSSFTLGEPPATISTLANGVLSDAP